jgi:quercetin dioxygenase-like cupin family protein
VVSVHAAIPAVWSLARKVKRHVGAKTLGGVLVTKIPPGGRVEPHVDGGWHASHYDKYAVQLKGNAQQAFCFEDSELRPEPGDLYTFDNSKLHWVTNDSDSERMTLIICLR